jgi:pimeloyl-ACP methyl ester carboxylesterase
MGRGAFTRQHDALGARYRLIGPSARGNDGTDPTLPPDYGFSTSELRDVLAVMDAEGVDKAHVVGHSSGGALAFELTRRHPERVSRLVLIEPSLIGLLPPERQSWVRGQISDKVEIHHRDGPMACVAASLAMVGGSAWASLDESARQQRLTPMESMSPILGPHWSGLLAIEVSPEDLASFHDDTMLIYAHEGSEFFEFEPDIAACWERERPDLKLLRVEGAGHNVHLDVPNVVNAAILEFLGGD